MAANDKPHLSGPALKDRVEKELDVSLDDELFGKAEQYARRKLDLCNERAGRQYGEDGYGDEYMVLLTADTVREMEFSAWTMARYQARHGAGQEAQERGA